MLLIFSTCGPLVNADTVPAQQTDQAIARALDWIDRHPASFEDGGMLEMVEEMIAFHVLIQNEKNPARFARHRQRMTQSAAQVAAILTANEQLLNTDPLRMLYPATYVISAYLLQHYDHNGHPARRILQRLLARHPDAHLKNPGYRYWNLAYLQRLGLVAGQPASNFIHASLTGSLIRDDGITQLSQAQIGEHLPHWYAITHDILALLDFRPHRGPLLPPAIHLRLNTVLNLAVGKAIQERQIDILAELLLCRELLGLERTQQTEEGISLLLSHQLADGSWGETKPNRLNGVRHGVLTAVSALVVYQSNATLRTVPVSPTTGSLAAGGSR